MSIELLCLTLLALFAAAMWIPFIIGVVTTTPAEAQAGSFLRPPDLTFLPAWVHRAHRAHLNLLEQLMPFALVVLIAHIQGVSNTMTQGAALGFLALRALHAVGMISGIARNPLRPLIFTAGFLCTLTIGIAILLA